MLGLGNCIPFPSFAAPASRPHLYPPCHCFSSRLQSATTLAYSVVVMLKMAVMGWLGALALMHIFFCVQVLCFAIAACLGFPLVFWKGVAVFVACIL